MAESKDEEKKKGGCLGKLATLIAFGGLIGLGLAVYQVSQAQDLSDLEGRGKGTPTESSRNLTEVMKNAKEGGYPLTITEKEINLFLAETLKAEQGGLLGDKVSIEDVAVRLEDGRAEVIIVRDVAGYPLTLSIYLRVEQIEHSDGRVSTRIFRDGGQFHKSLPRPGVGGRFGKLPVPEGFLVLVLPSFEKLAGLYRTPGGAITRPVRELDFVESMSRIQIEEGKLVLDPSPNAPVPLPGRR